MTNGSECRRCPHTRRDDTLDPADHADRRPAACWGGLMAQPAAAAAAAAAAATRVLVAIVEAVLLFAFCIPLWAARVDRMPPENSR